MPVPRTHDNDSTPVITAGSMNGYFNTGHYFDLRNRDASPFSGNSDGNAALHAQRRPGILYNQWLSEHPAINGDEPKSVSTKPPVRLGRLRSRQDQQLHRAPVAPRKRRERQNPKGDYGNIVDAARPQSKRRQSLRDADRYARCLRLPRRQGYTRAPGVPSRC